MNHKKSISLGLALSFVLSSTALAITPNQDLANELKASRERNMVLEAQISQENGLKGLKDSDTVRVIVEVEGSSVIEEANKKKIKVVDMEDSQIEKLQKNAMKSQKNVMSSLNRQRIKYEVLNTFTNVTNGFSAETTLGEAKKMQNIDGVKSVTIANEYTRPQEPDMNNSGEITKTQEAWTNGYNGEGKVVAIVDTGIDSTHKDMVISDRDKAALSKENIENISKNENLPGKYYTDKVPYGYNYMDGNSEIRDLGPDASEHGMHVAGIVGANGDKETGGIKGTAPEVQLLAMKVFGNNPAMSSTFGDVIIKAIDDSVVLGADVINMSLGSSSGTIDDKDPEQMAVNRAVDNGVVVSISSGNSNTYGEGYGYSLPYASNPDYGVTGAPGVATKSLSVASIENNITSGFAVEYSIDGKTQAYPYTTAGQNILNVLKGEALKVVDCGLGGSAAEFPEEVKGNVAMVERGAYAFTDKISNAEAAGAKAVIIYNNADGGDELINMAYPEGGKIPAVFMGHTPGSQIVGNSNVEGFTISFNGKTASAANPLAGEMSDFTSWGITPSLELKPEITGVGGNVWSTANNDGYQNMSGTSMAAPNVAGGSALVLQRVEEVLGLTGEDRVIAAKNILMNTAVPHEEGGVYTSPRRQGAGVMNLAGATSTTAVVTDSTTGAAKVELKEISGDSATFEINVENFGDKDITYKMGGTVQSDYNYEVYTLLQPQAILDKDSEKMPISFNSESVNVPAGGNAKVTVTVDLSNIILENGSEFDEAFVNGGYVEGFVTLTDVADTNCELSIPYVGFKGDWDKVPSIDSSIYDKDEVSFYGETAMFGSTDEEGSYNYLGLHSDATTLEEADENLIDFSPNADKFSDTVLARVSFLRNLEEGVVEIVDPETEKVLTTLSKMENVRKSYYDSGKYEMSHWLVDAEWDGTINGKLAPEGQYIYRVRVKAQTFEGDTAEWQNYDFKVNLDNTAPTITGVKLDEESKTLTVSAEDNLKGHEDVYLFLDPTTGDVVTSYDGVFDVSGIIDSGIEDVQYVVGAQDIAGNVGVGSLSDEPTGAAENDKTAPVVRVAAPAFFGTINTNEFVLEGTVEDESAIDEVTVDGEKVNLVYSNSEGVWHFSQPMTLEDGYHSIYVNAKDAAGNELGFAHKLFVDATAPVVELDEVPGITTADTVKISGRASDNFPDMHVKVNGKVVVSNEEDWSYFDSLPSADETFETVVELSEGENTITIEAADGAGNTTVNTVTVVNKETVENNVTKLVGTDRYATAVEVSKAGWDKSDYAVITNGTAYIDALVAAPIASTYNAPVLLTKADTLPDVTSAEIDRLEVKTVFIVGGNTVVTPEVEKQLTDSGIQVIRLAGNDRYETSLKAARYLERLDGGVSKAYVVGGTAEADAVSIASKAAAEKQPIILVKKDEVPGATLSWLKDRDIETAYVIGGTSVVSDSVLETLNEITAEDISGNRVSGANRYLTNTAIVERFYGDYTEAVVVTRGLPVVDALVVAPYAARLNAPVILVNDSLSNEQGDMLDGVTSPELIQVGGQVPSAVTEVMSDLLSK